MSTLVYEAPLQMNVPKDNELKLLTFHRKDILQFDVRPEAVVIDVAQASRGHTGIAITMDAVIRGGAEAFKRLELP